MINLPLIIVLLLGGFLRLYHLSSLPISLFGDEIDVGYHAWSLFTTGRDYLGNFLPTYIHSLSEWRAPLMMYFTAPFVGLLSPSAFSVRLPAALLGILNIYLIYFLANKLFAVSFRAKRSGVEESFNIGHIAAAMLAITPWHIHYSRVSFEVTLLTTLILSGTILYLSKKYFLALTLFILTFYTYSVANLFVPTLLFSLLLFFRPGKVRPSPQVLVKAFILLFLLLPIGYHLTFGEAAGRYRTISIFNDQKIIEDVILQRTDPWIAGFRLEPLFHNKVIAYAATFGRNYLTAFSPDFLFINGDPNFRQSVGRFGQLLWVCLPFLILGLLKIALWKNPSYRLVLAWFLLAPVGSALTIGGGSHATRLFVTLPPLILIAALGLTSFLSWQGKFSSKIRFSILATVSLATLLNLTGYWYRYEFHYRFESARVWNYGFEQIFGKLKELDRGEGRVFVNNTYDPSLYRFAFYTKLPPKDFQTSFHTDVPSDNILPHFNGFQFGERYYFGQIDRYENLLALLKPGDLYLAVQGKEVPGDWDWSKNPPLGIRSLAVVYDVLGQPLMYLLEKPSQ